MYFNYSNSLPNLFMQGDIVKEYPFSFIPKINDNIILRENNNSLRLVLNNEEDIFISENNFEEQLVVNSRLINIALLSQTCDLQRRETIMIAPVYSLEFLKNILADNGSDEQAINNKLALLRASRLEKQFHYYFYLPEIGNFPESYIDFNSIQSIPLENIDINKRILSLSNKGKHWLAYKLNSFFGRPVGFE